MPTPFTGQLGLPQSQLGLLQLGGPAYVQSFARSFPSPLVGPAGQPQARPFIAHVYQNDGVTPMGTLAVLNRPNLIATRANGGYGQVMLEVATRKPTPIYGQVIYGQPVYGAQVTVGNIIRLTEQGGDGSILYTGIVEDLPDSIGPSGVSHQILLSHVALELADCFSTSLYTTPVDVAQIARDAFSQTLHISCDQISVPASTGILAAVAGVVDFRNQSCQQQLDVARSIAGPTWFWHVDEVGRGWFQPMGSSAAYTFMRSQMEERTASQSIKNRKNQVLAIGGLPAGGSAPAQAVYNGPSQAPGPASIGVRALNPPLQIPGINDQPTLAFIAANVGAVLDRIWYRSMLKLPVAALKQRPVMQPGGIMIRYWEPAVSPLPESETGAGGYAGPFIAQTIEDLGTHLQVTAGDIPVTSQADVRNMITSLLGRISAYSLSFVQAALNVQGVVTGGGGMATAPNPVPPQVSAPRWVLDAVSLRVYDGTANNYGAPSGVGVVAEFGANGKTFLGSGLTLQSAASGPFMQLIAATPLFRINDGTRDRIDIGNLASYTDPSGIVSPAGYGGRFIDSAGNLLMDTSGVSQIMKSLGVVDVTNQTFNSVSFAAVAGASISFTTSRQVNLYCPFVGTGSVSAETNVGFLRARLTSGPGTTSGNLNFGTAQGMSASGWLWVPNLPAASYTIQLEAAINGGAITFTLIEAALQVFQLGA